VFKALAGEDLGTRHSTICHR